MSRLHPKNPTTQQPSDPNILNSVYCLDDFETLAREVLPRPTYEFIACGAADEHSLRRNTEAWTNIRLKPRVLTDTTTIDVSTRLLGIDLPCPILLAPTAYQRMVHSDGELASVSGAGEAGALYIVSTSTNTPLEALAEAAAGPLWFQLYVQPDREFTRDLVHRAEATNCKAICITVDNVNIGLRNRQHRSGFVLPDSMDTPHLYNAPDRKNPTREPGRHALTWDDIAWIRSLTALPLLLKGILNPDDAERAIGIGANGIIVSNHGGRNLDTLPPTAEALPVVAERVAGRVPVLVDGGIRRGTDVLKALALGAQAVLIGRPYVYALGVGGAEGVRKCIAILRTELEIAMALCGVCSLTEIDSKCIWP
jgi:4-hydroxymandelate oxidase